MEIGESYFKEIDLGLLKEADYNLAERTTDDYQNPDYRLFW